jgi:signal transduction histidine kinase
MGTWDWDLTRNTVVWSGNLEQIHGLPAGSFDGTFESYQREIHPDDREQVSASIARALSGAGEHDVEYRLVAPDGTIRWAEGKGRVEFEHGRPVRMSGVCMIVTRRKEAELAKLAAAHELARSKDEFLATLSHELRTPLNAVLGWLQMLQSGVTPPGQVADALKIIGRNAQLQAQLIDDILDVSRIISGSVEIRRDILAVQSLLDNAVNAVLPAARDKGVTLVADASASLPAVSGDASRLQQVLSNVLSNAVKFTDAGGCITVRAVAENGCAVIEVTDTGIGIPPEFLPLVFERFRQADSRSTRRHGGLGLGLAIARHFVELHGGTIAARSEGPGRGTTVRLALPAISHPGATDDESQTTTGTSPRDHGNPVAADAGSRLRAAASGAG